MSMRETLLGFIEGAGRAFDLFPDDEPPPFVPRDPSEDARNLAADWERVASDLSAAWEQELGKLGA